VVEVERTLRGHSIRRGKHHLAVEPRIVRVAGTTMISLTASMIASRVSTKTGRRLSGAAKVYQRTSPRLTELLPTLAFPAQRILVGRELVRPRGKRSIGRSIIVTAAGNEQREAREAQLLVVRELGDQRQQILGRQREAHRP
jgi:hypothetical protein